MTRIRKTLAPLLLSGLYLAILCSAGYLMDQPWTGAGLGLISHRDPPACSAWRRVNEGGFGLPANAGEAEETLPYQGEDGFEVLVYRDRLYVGMEADNRFGARLWRTRAGVRSPAGQSDWEEVIADDAGRPWGLEDPSLVDHVDSLAEYDGHLYVSSASTGESGGARVFRSASGDPGSWEDVLEGIGPGFGDPNNANFNDMVIFDGRLCGGTRNEVDGAEVWCTDGTTWERKNTPGFGEPGVRIAWSSAVFAGKLYLGVETVPADGSDGRSAGVYRTGSLAGAPEWEPVFAGDPFSFWAALLGSVDGWLYMATPGRDGIRIYRSATGDPDSWIPASVPGLANSRFNTTTVPDGAVLYRDTLFVSVRNPLLGFRVWRLRGDDFWEVVPETSTYDPNDIAAQLIVFNDALFAWTTNYHTGQAVLHSSCAELPYISIDGEN